MASVVVRPYEDRDEEGYFLVRSLTYNDGLVVPEDRRRARFSNRYVAEAEGEIVGVFGVLPMTATRGAALLKSGGVAGVGVLPDKRRLGVGRAMMDWLPRHLRENGVPLASLYAFREPFYARSGYAVVGKRLRVTVPSHRLPKPETSLPVRRLTPADWSQIHECHERFAHARSGVHVRNEKMWERVLNENKALTIYVAGDPIEGYVAVSHSSTFWVEQWLSEVAWSSRRGYEACLAMMHGLSINKSALAWYEPSDSPFYARFLDQGVDAKLERPVMFRVCDVPGALRALKPEGEGSFRLRVHDPVVPENEGPWRVTFGGGTVEVTEADGFDLDMDVQRFSQAFMGEPSLDELLRHELVTVGAKEATDAARRLLSPLPVFCSDFF